MFSIFGTIDNPFSTLGGPAGYLGTEGQGLVTLISSLVKFATAMAGLYTLFNLILAGYGYLSAGGDAKLVQKSQERIWRSVVGLIIVVSSIFLSAIIGYIVFGPTGWNWLISPVIYRP